MALFSFASHNRKKLAFQQPVTEHMSKAHKILGSTPLNIDAPPCHRDDASSAVLSDDRSATTITSLDPDSDFEDIDDDLPVGIAKSDNGWGEESGVLPNPSRADIDAGNVSDEASSILRKSRSSSTIKSWYDKSKLPLSISQQTSSSAMAKGPPIPPGTMLNFDPNALKALEANAVSDNRRKPAKLDLTNLIPGPRLMRKLSQTQLGSSPSNTETTLRPPKPTSMPSPITPTMRKFHQPRSPERCHRVSPALAAARSETSGRRGGSQWPRPSDALDALPTLYDHYEQMSMRHVMKQYSHPDLSRPKMEPRDARPASNSDGHSGRRSSKCTDWIEAALPPTPQTALPPKPAIKTSPAVPQAESVCSRQTRTSKASKATESSFASADLQQTSVLMLSSDSEGDDDEVMYSPKSRAPAVSRHSHALQKDAPHVAPCRLKSSKESSTSLDKSPCKSVKRASFALANTYITIPRESNGSSSRLSPLETPQDARFLSPTIDSMYADNDSRRASFASTYSACSATSAQSRRSSYSIREARAVTLMSTRHPSHQKRHVSDETRLWASDMNGSMRRASFNGSADQPTPPLSPSSVDFYIRSARSSIDEPENHSRLMAVSRQEELLLSALRQKHRAMRGSGFADLQESDDVYGKDDNTSRGQHRRSSLKRAANPSQRRDSSDGRSKAARTSFADLSVDDADYPSTLSTNDSSSLSERIPTSRMSRRRSAAAVSTGSKDEQPRRGSHPEKKHRNVPFILDETDPSPDLSDFRDWHAAMTTDKSLREKCGSRDGSVESQSHRQRTADPPAGLGRLHTQFRLDSFTRLSGVAEEGRGGADGEVDVPRPDSPISPDSFPAVPPERKVRSNLARLSAVGPGTLNGDRSR